VELEHHFIVPASIEEVWAAFNDPAKVAPCFPGATLISVNGDDFTGSAKIKLGPIALQYNGVGTYVQRDESAHRAVLEAKGKDKRGNGTANATVTAQLSTDGAGTAVHVTMDLTVTGKPAQFGRGVMQDVSDKLLGQFVACLQTKLGSTEVAQAPAGDEVPQAGAHDEVPQAAAHDEVPPAPAGDPQAAQVGAMPAPATDVAPAATPRESAASGSAAPRTRAGAYGQAPPPAPVANDGLNLLSTIGGVLLKRYAAPALGLLALIAGYLLVRRARR
jgi:carbon monoxide dehydrogenase subunit G